MSLDKLKKLKQVLETTKQERSKVEGQLKAAFDALMALGYATVPEANKAVERMDKELDQLDAQIEKTVQELEHKYAGLI